MVNSTFLCRKFAVFRNSRCTSLCHVGIVVQKSCRNLASFVKYSATHPHINAFLAHTLHGRCTPGVYHVCQQSILHPSMCKTGAGHTELTKAVCLKYIACVLYAVDGIIVALFTCSVRWQTTRRCKVHLQCALHVYITYSVYAVIAINGEQCRCSSG